MISCTDPPPVVHKTLVDIGEIDDASGAPAIDAPQSAAVGTAFVITVNTVGDPCFSVYSTDVAQTADDGDLTPYDRQIVPVGPRQACPISRITLAHEGTFQFASPGAKVITIHGAAGDLTVTVDVQ